MNQSEAIKKRASKAASLLGQRGAGKPKTLSDVERTRRAEWARGLAARRKSNAQP